MKKKIFVMLIMASLICFTSCTEDEDDKFNWPVETIYGTWNGTDVYTNGRWYDITNWLYSKFQFSITFYSDGTYYGKGYFGNGYGTYTASGNKIRTYVDGKPYYIYEVISLNNDNAHLYMRADGSNEKLEIKVKKQN